MPGVPFSSCPHTASPIGCTKQLISVARMSVPAAELIRPAGTKPFSMAQRNSASQCFCRSAGSTEASARATRTRMSCAVDSSPLAYFSRRTSTVTSCSGKAASRSSISIGRVPERRWRESGRESPILSPSGAGAVLIRIKTATSGSARIGAPFAAGRTMQKHVQWNVWYVVIAILAMIAFNDALRSWREVQPLPYSEFLTQLEAGNVDEIRVSADRIEGTLKRPLPDGRNRFATVRIEPGLAEDLARHEVKFRGVIGSTLLRDALGWVIPALLFFGLWSFLLRRFSERGGIGGGLMSIGRSKAKVYVETGVGVTFADVAGVDEAKEAVREVVGFLKDPTRYGRLGARIPKGLLLGGPPGTGTAVLPRPVAGEPGRAGAP